MLARVLSDDGKMIFMFLRVWLVIDHVGQELDGQAPGTVHIILKIELVIVFEDDLAALEEGDGEPGVIAHC